MPVSRGLQRRSRLWTFVAILLLVCMWLTLQWPHQSLWYDETLSAWVASSWDRLIYWCTQVDIQVPLHYIVLNSWMPLFGSTEFALHLLSFFCGLLAIAGLFALTCRLTRTTSAAAIAGLLLGLSPGFLWVAFEVRAYALALALYAWASVFLHEILKPIILKPDALKSSLRRWISVTYCALALAMLYTHYTGIGALAAHAVIAAWIIISRRSGGLARRMIGIGLVIAVGFAPWLPILFTRSSADHSYYTGAIEPDQTLGVLLSFKWLARDDFKWLTPDHTISTLAPLIAGGLIILVVGVIAWIAQRRDSLLPVLYGVCMALLPGLMVAIVVLFKPKLAGRYAWPSWIGLDLLLALGIVALSTGWRTAIRRVLPLTLAALLISIPWLTGQVGHPPDSDFRGVFATINAHWQPGDLVLLRDGTLFPAAAYYHSPEPLIGLPQSDLTDATHILHAAEAAPILAAQPDSIRGVWVVSWQSNVMDPENVSVGLLETIGQRRPTESSFGDVGLEYFKLDAPLSTLKAPLSSPKPLLVMPDGLTLDSASLVNESTLQPGEPIIAHTWWRRGDPVRIDSRVSIRLYSADGRTLAQLDQPPAGWFYFPDHWPGHALILGRYELMLPPDTAGRVTMKLVIYSAANDITPLEVTIGTLATAATTQTR